MFAYTQSHRLAWAALRLLSCMAFVLVGLSANDAHASAPMCDPSAATVVADIPAPPADTGEIDALPPCPLKDYSTGFDVAHPQPDQPVAHLQPPPDRDLPSVISYCWGAASVIRVLSVDYDDLSRPGYSSEVYRPPCS